MQLEITKNKMKKLVVYHQKFRQEWKLDPALKNWLCEDKENKNRAYCRYCECNLLSKYCYLLTHSKTRKHLRAASAFEDNGEALELNEDTFTLSTENIEKKIKIKKENKTPFCRKSLGDQDNVESMIDYNIFSDEDDNEDDIFEECKPNKKSVIPKKLQVERAKAETEYFRQKALYYSKLTENARVQRTLIILQSRKLHLEVKQLQKAQNEEQLSNSMD